MKESDEAPILRSTALTAPGRLKSFEQQHCARKSFIKLAIQNCIPFSCIRYADMRARELETVRHVLATAVGITASSLARQARGARGVSEHMADAKHRSLGFEK